MQTGSKYRLFSLLLALGMLLGLVATGCSDKDRDGSNKPTPTDTKQIVFVYEKEKNSDKVLGKVPYNAVSIQATAIAADGSVIDGGAKLDTTEVAKQLHKDDGKYYAYTTVTAATDKVIYTFYYTTTSGEQLSTYVCTLPGVAGLDEDARVTENDVVKHGVSAVCLDAQDQERTSFQVGEEFQIQVLDGVGKPINDVSFSAYNAEVVKPVADKNGFFSALNNGDTYFYIKFQGVTISRKFGPVVVGNAPAPTLDKLLLCPNGYSVKKGDLYDKNDRVVTDYSTLPTSIADLNQGESYTFFVAGVYTDQAVVEMKDTGVTLAPSAADLVDVKGFTVTAKSDAVGAEGITAKHTESGQVSNAIKFNIVVPTLDQLLLCPDGYSVKGDKLYDENGKEVTDYSTIPTSIADLIQGEDYTFFVAGVYTNKAVVEMKDTEVTLAPSAAKLVDVKGFTVTAKSDAVGAEVITATHTDSGKVSNEVKFNVVAPTLNQLLLCPDGYSVHDDKLYDENGKVVTDYSTIPTSIADLIQGESYTFFVAGVYTNKVVVEMPAGDVTLTASNSQATVAGLKITVKADATGDEIITAKHENPELESNEVSFTVAVAPEPSLEQLLLCPNGYKVQDNKLYDANGDEVTDYSTIPTSIGDLIQGKQYTFFVAGLYTNIIVREVREVPVDQVELIPDGNLVAVDGFTVTASTEATGSEIVSAKHTETTKVSNSIGIEVVAPTLSKLLLCPNGYLVRDGKLIDADNEEVTDYDSLPATIADLNEDDSYTFFVAGVYTDDVVREMQPSDSLSLKCEPEVTVDGFTVKADPGQGDTVAVTACSTDPETVTSNTITFKVLPKLVSLRVKSEEETVKMQGKVQLEAEAVYSDGSTGPVPIDLKKKWTSSDGDVATVNDAGLVTGVAVGSVSIAVQSADDTYPCSRTCKVTVAPEVGDIITMGKWYDKDDQLTEAITWKVMKIEEATGTTPKRALVVAEKALDVQKYNTEYAVMTWKKCSLRRWLTGSDEEGTDSTFYITAFTDAEKAKIALTEHTTCNWGGTGEYGEATKDLVFLLDEAEAKDLYPSNAERKCQCTEYATKQGASSSDDYCLWWLRSPGPSAGLAAYVKSFGDFNYDVVTYVYIAVRPALYIAL